MNFFNEQTIELLESFKVPNTYWKNGTKEYKYWFRSLLQKIDSSIIFDGLPAGWNNDFFMICLWALGRVCVFKPDAELLTSQGAKFVVDNVAVFQPCTLSGYDFYYQPNKAIVSNPVMNGSKTFTIGDTCELIKLTPDYCGIFDIIDYYATKLAEISKGIDVGLINAKMPVILTASSDAQAETLKKVYDKVQAGESLVIWGDETDAGEVIPRKNAFEEWTQDYKKTYLVHNLLEDMQIILDSFYVEIGLPVAIEKKERIITSEADFASAQSQARISCWLETLKESLVKVNKMFNTNITCEVAYELREVNNNRDRELSE